MAEIVAEIRKIPPVTRFLCGSSLAVTIPVLLGMVTPYSVLYVRDFVFKKFEIWRLWSSFFFGSSGINYIFEIAMLYRTSNELEGAAYLNRSADYAWQLIFASASIIAATTPLKAFIFSRPLLVCLTYLSSALAPAGAQSGFMGLITFPVKYMPFFMIGMDLLMAGPQAAGQSVAGAIVGHFWWWGVWGSRPSTGGPGVLEEMGTAPNWFRKYFGEAPPPPGGTAAMPRNVGGVHIIPPRRPTAAAAAAAPAPGAAAARTGGASGGYSWGQGQRLGTE